MLRKTEKMKIQLISLIMVFALHTMASQNLIETTCKSTPNYHLCATTLKASPGSSTADVADLGLIMVAAVKAKSREALSTIHKLRRRRQPKLSQALQRCAEVYKAVFEGDVAVAEQALRGNPKFAETAMAGVALEADTCEDAFEGVVVPPPALSGVNKVVHELALVARAIIRNLL
ncbi:hypothetical protein ACS0TY_022523 [Phlomoides rotata]